MRIHPEVNHANGLVTVVLRAQFPGDPTDADDSARVAAYGDPQINLGGQFTLDPGPPAVTFTTGAMEVWVGLTQQMHQRPVRFMSSLPTPTTLQPLALPGPLDVIVSDPVRAAQVYVSALQSRIATAMTALRAKTPAKLTTLPDATV